MSRPRLETTGSQTIDQGEFGYSPPNSAEEEEEDEDQERGENEETYWESSASSTPSESLSWIAWWCSHVGHEYFTEVSEDFIEDDFNLTPLPSQVPFYREALDLILDVDPEEDTEFARVPDARVIESAAELLYGLIHQRYICSRTGIHAMGEKYDGGHFGHCPRVYCLNTPVLPVGRFDTPGLDTVKLFCPSCLDIYMPPNSRFHGIDGAYFGTTFPHLFFQTFPEVSPRFRQQIYVPRIYGFRVSQKSIAGPSMSWLRRYTGAQDRDPVPALTDEQILQAQEQLEIKQRKDHFDRGMRALTQQHEQNQLHQRPGVSVVAQGISYPLGPALRGTSSLIPLTSRPLPHEDPLQIELTPGEEELEVLEGEGVDDHSNNAATQRGTFKDNRVVQGDLDADVLDRDEDEDEEEETEGEEEAEEGEQGNQGDQDILEDIQIEDDVGLDGNGEDEGDEDEGDGEGEKMERGEDDKMDLGTRGNDLIRLAKRDFGNGNGTRNGVIVR